MPVTTNSRVSGAKLPAVPVRVNSDTVDPGPAIFQFGLTLALFPFVTWLFARVHHSVLRQT